MLSVTLSGATLRAPYRGRSLMLRKAKEYHLSAKRLKSDGDSRSAVLHQELYVVHRALSQGKRLLSVNKAMEIAGCKPNGHPVLAIANASARWVWFIKDAERIVDPDGRWQHPSSAFISDYAVNPGWDDKRKIAYYDHDSVFRFVEPHFPIRMNESRISARVPVVPAKLLPAKRLNSFAILWEADWAHAPKDPFLLKRITREWYEVCAEWDLTSIERMVLEMATFAGEQREEHEAAHAL